MKIHKFFCLTLLLSILPSCKAGQNKEHFTDPLENLRRRLSDLTHLENEQPERNEEFDDDHLTISTNDTNAEEPTLPQDLSVFRDLIMGNNAPQEESSAEFKKEVAAFRAALPSEETIVTPSLSDKQTKPSPTKNQRTPEAINEEEEGMKKAAFLKTQYDALTFSLKELSAVPNKTPGYIQSLRVIEATRREIKADLDTALLGLAYRKMLSDNLMNDPCNIF